MPRSTKNAAAVYLSRWPENSDTHVTMRGALNKVAQVLGSSNAEAYPWHKLRYETARSIPAKPRDGRA